MKSSRSDLTFIKNNRKKCTALAALAMCLGAYQVTGSMLSQETTEPEEIPFHDGDILVDSINVADDESSDGEFDESALVTSDDVAELENTDTYFQELRATLDMDRNKIISMLTDAESTASTSQEKEDASREKMKLLKYMEQEKTIETLIKNKGLPESFVVITDQGVNVTVNTDNLDQSTVTRICEIVMRQTERKADELVVQSAS